MYTPTSGLTAAAGTATATTATARDNALSARLAAIAYAQWLANGGTEGRGQPLTDSHRGLSGDSLPDRPRPRQPHEQRAADELRSCSEPVICDVL
ncbi:hypothetical protein [Streptomyces sp. NPDC051572]|jgi:hypothetical protein|uniref:hypothetical protein n=1 Tax=unclassified Streptomyces TaxID=2593676 RepID=UPI00344BCADF